MLELRYKNSQETTETGDDCPEVSPISFRVTHGFLRPIVWYMGEAECAYCGCLSSSYQGIQKHMQSYHRDEMKEHRHKMLLHGPMRPKSSWTEGDTCAPMLSSDEAEAFDILWATKEEIFKSLPTTSQKLGSNKKTKLGGPQPQPKQAEQKATSQTTTTTTSKKRIRPQKTSTTV